MPVWHARTREAVESGKIKVLAITQEQHAQRCRIFLQWKKIDWPVLWDPFNLTGSKVVPNFTLVDEHGVVRVPRARLEDLPRFLETDYAAPKEVPRPTKGPRDRVIQALGNEPSLEEWILLSDLLWRRTANPTALLEVLEFTLRSEASFDPTGAERLFRSGVAHRMRYESPFAQHDDFQIALDLWASALRLRPDQYIWRRRIQQYGPRPDKPYPFYDWVDRARRDIEAHGEIPVDLPVALSATEQNAWHASAAGTEEPDPEGKVPNAGAGPVIAIESAVAWDTSGRSRSGRLHLRIRPVARDQATWTTEQDPIVLWLHTPEAGTWIVSPQRLEAPTPTGDDDDNTGSVDPVAFECNLTAPPRPSGDLRLRGYVLAPICRVADGTCLVVREEFEARVEPPPRR